MDGLMDTWINDRMHFMWSKDWVTTHMLMTPKPTLPAFSLSRARSTYPASRGTSVLSWSRGMQISMPQTELINPSNLTLLLLLGSFLLWYEWLCHPPSCPSWKPENHILFVPVPYPLHSVTKSCWSYHFDLIPILYRPTDSLLVTCLSFISWIIAPDYLAYCKSCLQPIHALPSHQENLPTEQLQSCLTFSSGSSLL